MVRNDLPVAAHFALWERSPKGGAPVLRQQGRLEGGGAVNVYSVDMRQQVLLSFYPDGCVWPRDQAPVVISEGFLGDAAGISSSSGGAAAPGGFYVEYMNSQASVRLRVNMTKELDLELVESQRLRAMAARAQAAGGASGSASYTFTAGASDAATEGMRLGAGVALAQGRPLTLHLWVPLWVVNGTQLPISTGLVAIAAGGEGGESGGGGGGGAGGAGGGGADGGAESAPMRVLDTEAFTQLVRPEGQVTIMPNSIELLSYPDGSVGGGAADGAAWAAVVSVMGSRWSAPLQILQAAGATSAAAAAAAVDAARLPRFEPVLIRARSKPDGSQHEVTARIEGAGSGFQRCMVLRLEPHLVVSNRTGHTLHLLQPEPIWRALGGVGAPPGFLGPMQGGGNGGGGNGSGSGGNAAWFAPASVADIRSGTSGAPTALRRPPSLASSTPVRDATVVLNPGAVGVPVSWPSGCVSRLLALTLPQPAPAPGSAAAAAAAAATAGRAPSPGPGRVGGEDADPLLWSESFKVEYPASGSMQVVLPVLRIGAPGETVPVDAKALAAAHAEFDRLTARRNKGAGAGALAAPARPLGGAEEGGDKGGWPIGSVVVEPWSPEFVHVAKYTEGGLQEYLAVAVQVSIEMRAQGCLHLVLQSLGGEAQYLLQVRLPFCGGLGLTEFLVPAGSDKSLAPLLSNQPNPKPIQSPAPRTPPTTPSSTAKPAPTPRGSPSPRSRPPASSCCSPRWAPPARRRPRSSCGTPTPRLPARPSAASTAPSRRV